jgi:hypothetical protein
VKIMRSRTEPHVSTTYRRANRNDFLSFATSLRLCDFAGTPVGRFSNLRFPHARFPQSRKDARKNRFILWK